MAFSWSIVVQVDVYYRDPNELGSSSRPAQGACELGLELNTAGEKKGQILRKPGGLGQEMGIQFGGGFAGQGSLG